ncbi:unnamed protein product, partial [marine sediment metagenome]
FLGYVKKTGLERPKIMSMLFTDEGYKELTNV